MRKVLLRALSHIWPVRVWSGEGAHGGLELCWENGRLVINSARANQSGGSLYRVWQEVLHRARAEQALEGPVLMLGFGGGSAATILRKELHITAPITGVDDDPRMLHLARTHFGMATWPALTLVQQDAFAFLAGAPDASFHTVLVDLFHDLDLAPGVGSEDFFKHLRRVLVPGGRAFINTVEHSGEAAQRSSLLATRSRHYFRQVVESTHEGSNRVFMAS